METRRFWNPSLPQTLQSAVVLCYIIAFFTLIAVLDRGSGWRRLGLELRLDELADLGGITMLVWLAIIAGLAAGGYLIANSKKLGWQIATAAAVTHLVLRVFVLRGQILEGDILGFMFDAALAVVLLHPQSREHQRIWFD